jgi:hypothetical protein
MHVLSSPSLGKDYSIPAMQVGLQVARQHVSKRNRPSIIPSPSSSLSKGLLFGKEKIVVLAQPGELS